VSDPLHTPASDVREHADCCELQLPYRPTWICLHITKSLFLH